MCSLPAFEVPPRLMLSTFRTNADVKQPRAVRAMDTFASYIKGHVTRPSGEPTIGFIVDW